MKKFCIAFAVLAVLVPALAIIAAEGDDQGKKADYVVACVPEDAVSFDVTMDQVVSLPLVKCPSGTLVDTKVVGPAKVTKYQFRPIRNGKPLIGSADVQLILKPTDKGKVKVSVTTKFPGSQQATTTDYQFEVK